MTGSSCRRTKSQTGAERSAWRDTSESDRGKETPRYLMNIQKSDSPTDLKVFTEWDMQECNDFSVKISYGWVAALKENIALLQVIVRLLWLLWFEVLKISIAWAALLTPHLCMFSPQALQHCLWRQSQIWGVVALLQNMSLVIFRSLWLSWFEDLNEMSISTKGVARWSVHKWKWNQICLLWYYYELCELFGLFNSIERFVISQNRGSWPLTESWHGNSNSNNHKLAKELNF